MKNNADKKQPLQFSFEAHLKAAIDHYWAKDNSCIWLAPGEPSCEERMANALKDLLSRNIISSEENCIKIVTENRYTSLYECGIYSFVDLREEMLGDTCLWSIDTKDKYEFIDLHTDEDVLKEHLTLEGWFISNGMAIKLTDDMLSPIFIRCRDRILDLKR